MIPAVSLGDPQFTANVHDGIARITELINSELSQADEVMRDTVAHLVDAGGTPFRPLFTVLAAQLGSDPDGWEVTVAGAAIELMHLGTLCHDRVVDESDMSRKTPSDNTRWTNNFAILAGDYRFATASDIVENAGHIIRGDIAGGASGIVKDSIDIATHAVDRTKEVFTGKTDDEG